MERSTSTEFAPSRNNGIMIHDDVDERLTWALGVFHDTNDQGKGTADGKYNVTGRITGVPRFENKGRKLLHLGLAYSYRDPDGLVEYDARPESHLSKKLLKTAVPFAAKTISLVGLEGATVLGPLSLQTEYVHNFVNRPIGPDVEFNAFYVQASYFFTGEHRNYDTEAAEFGRVKPQKNFGDQGGIGAWEIVARYSQMDLNDEDIRDGRLRDFTLGLNWYLYPNVRWMWNYVLANLNNVGDTNIFQTRFQIDF